MNQLSPNKLLPLCLLSLATFAAACGGELATGDEAVSADDEAWTAAGNPAIFGTGLNYTLAKLPAKGEAKVIPWTGSYWPTANDNINYKWAGPSSDSAAKKYEKAFGLTGVEDAVSRAHGIDSRSSAKACTANSACDSATGEICAKRTGQTSGRCIPTWFGICHAWGPASILMPEPRHEVVKNGVTFKIQDLKALASLVHNSTSSKFVSLRCNQTNRANGIAFDQYGRPTDESCRDSNAGSYHLILANYLGLKGVSFVEDRTQDAEVWNQPMRGYRVVAQRAVTAQEANRLIGVTAQGGAVTTKSATVAKGAWLHLPALTVAAGQPYSVKMTGTADGDLYVRFGAQPTGTGYDCRPYTNGSAEECGGVVPAGATRLFVSVNGYSASDISLTMSVGGSVPVKYVFNSKARSFAYVQTDVDYISEASPETDGYLTPHIDSYTQTDHYEYILELDTAGRIIGGEWIGASKQAHPDFMWLPTGVTTSTVAGGKISYAEVKALMAASVL